MLDHETVLAPGVLIGPGAHGPDRNLTTSVIMGADLPPPSVSVTEWRVQATVHLSPNCAMVTTRS